MTSPDRTTHLTLYTSPHFVRTAHGWQEASAALTRGTDHTIRADHTVIPMTFGPPAKALLSLRTGMGPIVMSLPHAKAAVPTAIADGLRFSDVATTTDLQYEIHPSSVKEKIVLRSAQSPRSFTFLVHDPGHRLGMPRRLPDESWEFPNAISGDFRVALAPPAAWELKPLLAAGAQRGRARASAHQSVVVVHEGYKLTVAVDVDWLQGRQFPIVLDPSVRFIEQPPSLSPFGNAPIESTVCGPLCSLAHYTFMIEVGADATHGEIRAFIQTDLAQQGNPSYVTAATLRFENYCTMRFGLQSTCLPLQKGIELHELARRMTNDIDTGADLVAAEAPEIAASGLIANYSRVDGSVSNINNIDVTESVNHFLMTGRANAVAWAIQNTNPAQDVIASDITLDLTYGGDAPPPVVPVQQTYGCGCPGNQAPAAVGSAADPIRTNTGAPFETAADLEMPAPGEHVAWTRAYNGADPTIGTLGAGWTQPFEAKLTQDLSNGTVTVRNATGGQTRFVLLPDGSYLPDPGVTARLADNPGGGWTLTDSQQASRVFNASGNLTRSQDAQGRGVTVGYANGKAVSLTDSVGQTTVLSYGGSGAGNGLVAAVTTPDGRAVHYGYTSIAGAPRLTSITAVDGGVTTVSYDATTGILDAVTDPDGHSSSQNTIEPVTGRVIAQRDATGALTSFSWDPATYTQTVTDPLGRVSKDIYSNGNVLLDHIDAAGGRTHYVYDADLNRVAVVDPMGRVTQMSYDSRGNLLSRTSPAPSLTTEQWTYDANNHALTYVDGRGGITTYTYTGNGQLETLTDAAGGIQSFTYTAQGQVATRSDQLQHVTTYGYDGVGNLTSVTSPTGDVTTMTYDNAHRLIAQVDPRGNAPGCNCATAFRTRWTYDAAGRLLTRTDPLGQMTTHTYDAAGNKTATVDARGKITQYTYDAVDRPLTITDPLGHLTTYTYDAVGNTVGVRDANNHTTTRSYDNLNRPVSLTRADGTVLQSTYDRLGNLLRQTDGAGNSTSYRYNTLNQLTSATSPPTYASTDGITRTYTYDANGQLLTSADSAGQVTTYARDPLNRVTDIHYADPGTPEVSYSYDAAGHRLSMTDGTGDTTYSYDALGRLTATTESGGTVGFGYDAAGHPSAITYPNGKTVTRGYDGAGRLTAVTDWNGRATQFGYDANGMLTSIIYPNGITESRANDDSSQLTRLTDVLGGGATATTLADYTYGRDPAGLVTTAVEAGPAGSANETYGHTSIDQLSNYTTATTSGAYAYDLADNVTGTADGRTQTYDPANELLSQTSGPTAVTYGYGARGNRLSATTGASVNQFGYDLADRLTTYVSGNGLTSASYQYNGDGLRTAKTVNGTATPFTWDSVTGSVPLLLTDGAVSFIYGPNDLLIEQINPGITLIGSATATSVKPDPNTMTLATPTGTRSGDVLIVLVNEDVTQTSTVAGFASLACPCDSGGVAGERLQAFRMTVGASVGPTVSVATSSTLPVAHPRSALILAYRGLDQIAAIGGSTASGATGSTSGPTPLAVPSIGGADKGDRLLFVGGALNDVTDPAWTPPAGMSPRATAHQSLSTLFAADLSLPADGSTGVRTASLNTVAGATVSARGLAVLLKAHAVDYVHHDLLGSTRLLTSQRGMVEGGYKYDPYGRTSQHLGPSSSSLQYNGQYRDSETGLYYLRARYYDPGTAQFLTRDPLEAQTRTPYGYADGSPLNKSDPSGEAVFMNCTAVEADFVVVHMAKIKCLAVDSYGNLAVLRTKVGGLGLGLGATLLAFSGVSDAPSVFNLSGAYGLETSVTLGAGLVAGTAGGERGLGGDHTAKAGMGAGAGFDVAVVLGALAHTEVHWLGCTTPFRPDLRESSSEPPR